MKDMIQNFLEELQPTDGSSDEGSKEYFSPPIEKGVLGHTKDLKKI